MRIYGADLIKPECRVCANFERDGYFEPASIDVWMANCRPGFVALDIGSYTGLYAIIAAQHGAVSVAYEPNPVVYARLKENIARNKVQVETHKAAVSDVEGTIPFWFRFDMTSAGRITKKDGYQETTVKCVKLREPRRVSVMKIDVEGAEINVLRGAREIIERDRPVIIAEALSVNKQDALDKFMLGMGYRVSPADRRNMVYTYG